MEYKDHPGSFYRTLYNITYQFSKGNLQRLLRKITLDLKYDNQTYVSSTVVVVFLNDVQHNNYRRILKFLTLLEKEDVRFVFVTSKLKITLVNVFQNMVLSYVDVLLTTNDFVKNIDKICVNVAKLVCKN